MKLGDTIKIRQVGQHTWVEGRIDLISPNQASLVVSADEGLSSHGGFAIDPDTGRQQLLLGRGHELEKGHYQDIVSGMEWEIREAGVQHD